MNFFSFQTIAIGVVTLLAIGIAVFNPGLYPIFSDTPPQFVTEP